MGSRCVICIRNAKSVVKWWMYLNEVKGNTSAGKSDVLLVRSTATPKRTDVSWNPSKRKVKGRNRRMTTTTRKKKKRRKRTFCSLILSVCRKRAFTYPISWWIKMMKDTNRCLRGQHVQGLLRLVVWWKYGQVCVHCPQLQRV